MYTNGGIIQVMSSKREETIAIPTSTWLLIASRRQNEKVRVPGGYERGVFKMIIKMICVGKSVWIGE